jgi:predicted ATPase
MGIQVRVLHNTKWAKDGEPVYFQKDQIVTLSEHEVSLYPDLFMSIAEEQHREAQKQSVPPVQSSQDRHNEMKAKIMEEEEQAREAKALFLEIEAQKQVEVAKTAAARLRTANKTAKPAKG